MSNITQTENKIEIVEAMPKGVRVFLFFLGLFPWLAPYGLLIKPGWTGFNIATLLFLIISLGAIAISFGFISAAVFGANQAIVIDRSARTITHRYETAINALRTKRYAFHDIAKTKVREHDWDTGPRTYSLEVHFKDRHKILCGDFPSRREAETVLTQIR